MIPSCTEADMPERRRAGRRVAGILAVAVVVTAAVLVVKYGGRFAGRPGIRDGQRRSVAIHCNSTLAELNKALANNDLRALPIIQERATPKPQYADAGLYRDGGDRVDRDLAGRCARAIAR